MLLPKLEKLLWEPRQCFFPAGLLLVDGASTVRAKLIWESSNFDFRQPIAHGALDDRCGALQPLVIGYARRLRKTIQQRLLFGRRFGLCACVLRGLCPFNLSYFNSASCC